MKKRVNFFDKVLNFFRIGILETSTGIVKSSDGRKRHKRDCPTIEDSKF